MVGAWRDKSECDITAMAVQALSFYYTGSDKSVKKSVDKAKFLSRQQNNDGGYSAEGISNCESTAQVLMAISALNINIEDSRFVKNGIQYLTGFLDYYSNGKFSHTKNGGYNHMATEQGFCALTAYYRSLTIMNGFYDMADGISYQKVSKKVLEKKKTAASKTKTTKTVKKTTKKSTKKNTSKSTVSDKDKEETTSVKNNKKSSSSNKKSNKNTKTKSTKNSKSKTNKKVKKSNKKVKKSNKKEESETTVKNSKNNTSDDAKVGEKEAKINDVNGKKNQSNRTEIVIGVIAAVVMVIAIIVYIIGKRKAENEK